MDGANSIYHPPWVSPVSPTTFPTQFAIIICSQVSWQRAALGSELYRWTWTMKDHETVETVPEIEPLCVTNVLKTPTEDSGNVQNDRSRLWLVVLCGSFAFIVSGRVKAKFSEMVYSRQLQVCQVGAQVFHEQRWFSINPLHQVFPSTSAVVSLF